jgi:hypothetical protein
MFFAQKIVLPGFLRNAKSNRLSHVAILHNEGAVAAVDCA